MSFAADMKILYHLALKPVRGDSHAARMESFYSGQADDYDDFRRRLLKGRQELWDKIEVPEGGTWVDMGGGTGSNLNYFGESLSKLNKIYVVDLCSSLLKVASERFAAEGWTNAEAVEADATTFRPPEQVVDVVTCSYSLTMIPDWFAAIDNALAMLRPGGTIAIVDFYVGRKHPQNDLKRHTWSTRNFWRGWLENDNVFPSADHLPYLQRHFETIHVSEYRGKIPYLPIVRAPYYLFIGRKPE